MAMKFYWVIKLGEFVGCRKFSSREDAAGAARRMSNLTGKKWVVDKIFY